MNETLNQALIEFVNAIKAGTEFVMSETPVVIQQLILYKTVWYKRSF